MDGEGGPDAWHHSLSFPARTELWLLQVRTAAAAEGATPPAVPRRVLINLRSWGGFKIKKKILKSNSLTRQRKPVNRSSTGPAAGTHAFHTNRGDYCFVLIMKMWGFTSWEERNRNSEADKKGRHTSLSPSSWLCPATFICKVIFFFFFFIRRAGKCHCQNEALKQKLGMWAFGVGAHEPCVILPPSHPHSEAGKCPVRRSIWEYCKEAFPSSHGSFFSFSFFNEMLYSPGLSGRLRLCHRRAAAGEQSISAAGARRISITVNDCRNRHDFPFIPPLGVNYIFFNLAKWNETWVVSVAERRSRRISLTLVVDV